MTDRPLHLRGSVAPPVKGAFISAMSLALTAGSVSYGNTLADHVRHVHHASMTPQDQDFLTARIDSKVAELKGDIRLNTQGIADLREHFADLSARMVSVPVDLAVVKTKVEALPGKAFVVTSAVGAVTGLTALLALLQKLGVVH